MLRYFCLLALTVGISAAQPVVSAVLDGAGYGSKVAPGGIVSLFGTGLAAGTMATGTLPLPVTMLGTSVEVLDDGRTVEAPLYFVSPGQVNAQLPYQLGALAEVRVKAPGGTSAAVPLNLVATAPAFFSMNFDGKDRPVAVHSDWRMVENAAPVKPGETLVLYMNGLGSVSPEIQAGAQPENDTLHPANLKPSVSVNGHVGRVDFAGLAPGLPGVYQVNVLTPYDNVAGDVPVMAESAGSASQASLYLRVEPNGFNWLIPAGKRVNGQEQYGATAEHGALAFRHLDATVWGETGLASWTRDIYGPELDGLYGLALTLRNNGAIVYDNNGIDDGTFGKFYDNTAGRADDIVPGLFEMYSMSVNLPGVGAGAFRLSLRTTITEITGYFDGNGQASLRFDPANPYNTWRMNIWSDQGGRPTDTGNFTGDLFSTDNWPGKFAGYSPTSAQRIFHDGASDVIYRLSYQLESPLTLKPGDYWFSQDVATPELEQADAKGMRSASTADRVVPPSKLSNAK